jgi:cytochrome c oxidase subunit 2
MQTFLAMFPKQASAHAAEVDQMTILVHWLMLVLFIGWGLFFIFVLFRFRRGANPKASYSGAKGKISKGLEVAVALIEVLLLVFYAIPAWAKRVKAFPSENEATVVRVVAEQFAWNIHYPGPDGKFGRTDIALVSADNPIGLDRRDPNAKDDITTINQLNLPIDRPVLVHLTSKDVIHSFGLYEMRVKQDAIPGMTIPVWFIPNRVGEYEIACSQLCGLGHFRMRGFITIQSQADYQKWYDAQEKELQPAPTATPTAPYSTKYEVRSPKPRKLGSRVPRTSNFVLFRVPAAVPRRVRRRAGTRDWPPSHPLPPTPGS